MDKPFYNNSDKRPITTDVCPELMIRVFIEGHNVFNHVILCK